MKVYAGSYITNEIRLYTKLSELWTAKLYPAQQINTLRKLNVNL